MHVAQVESVWGVITELGIAGLWYRGVWYTVHVVREIVNCVIGASLVIYHFICNFHGFNIENLVVEVDLYQCKVSVIADDLPLFVIVSVRHKRSVNHGIEKDSVEVDCNVEDFVVLGGPKNHWILYDSIFTPHSIVNDVCHLKSMSNCQRARDSPGACCHRWSLRWGSSSLGLRQNSFPGWVWCFSSFSLPSP